MLSTRARRFLRVSGGVAALLAVFACSSESSSTGAIMLAVSTNMQAPKDIDAVGLRITSDGVPIFDDTRQVAPDGEVRFPATLAILASANPRAVVKIRLVAFRGGEGRILRDAVTTVPRDRVALLRLPIQWVNDGSASGDTLIPLAQMRSICTNPDETSIDGRCQSALIDVDALPSYDEREVFGGGTSSRGDGACFDTRACFAAPMALALDPAACTVLRPAGIGAERFNLAIMLPPGTDGECTDAGCVIPLDADSASGFLPADVPNPDGTTTLKLPEGVCARIAEGKATGIAASFTCEPKRETTPPCGVASAVQGSPIVPLVDGGAPPPSSGEGGADASPVAPRDGGGETRPPFCGDGIVESPETCDDGNRNSGDGCSAQCAVEAGYVCPPPSYVCMPDTDAGDAG